MLGAWILFNSFLDRLDNHLKINIFPKEMFWATRGKRMMDMDDFWATRGKKAALEGAHQTKRSLKPNGLFSSIKRAENSLKRPFLKPNGLFGSFKRNFKPNGLFSTFKRGSISSFEFHYKLFD